MRHFLSMLDLQPQELSTLLSRALSMKQLRSSGDQPRPLVGKSVGVLMEKASTRTRVSFEVGIGELGGQVISLVGRDLQMGRDEPLADTARVLSRYLNAVVLRTHGHDRIEALSGASDIPFINALTDKFHPCQLLADLMTICEARREGLSGLRVAWVGDGHNMAHSWILASAVADFELGLACPEGYRPDTDVIEMAEATGRGSVTLTDDVESVLGGAHVVTTDVWASMGQEEEAQARRKAFVDYSVDEARMGLAAADAIFLHCLPAHRGEEVSAEVIDGPQSRVWDEAENRLHAQKALLELLLSE